MVAGQMYGSRIATFDLEIVYDADEANMKRIATFLLGIDAYVEDAWPNEGTGFDFSLDVFLRERSLTVGTSEGEIDLLDRIDGLGTYAEVNEQSAPIETAEGLEVWVLTLDGLIAAERASNREKDRLHIVEFEALADMNRHRDPRGN